MIVVDENVDPFDLKQVMWAMSVKVNPAGDIVTIPNLAENLLDPACSPGGIVTKMIIDATTPVAPDVRGDYGEELDRAAWHRSVANEALGLGEGDAQMTESSVRAASDRMPAVPIGHTRGGWQIFRCRRLEHASVVQPASMPGDRPSPRRT